jgi:DNA-binding transcriptional regulator YiaG
MQVSLDRPRSGKDGQTLKEFDATPLVGLRTLVHDAAIERVNEHGERTVELPNLRELLAAAAMKRCLTPIRLRGHEIKAMRRIMKFTLGDLAKRLDERTAVETVSRWETEAQPMGGYVEKLLRLLVCEELKKEAPGIQYDAGMIANLRVLDPWRANAAYELPAIELWYIDAWNAKMAA